MKVENLNFSDASIKFQMLGGVEMKKETKRKTMEEMREASAYNPTTACRYDAMNKRVVATIKYANQIVKHDGHKHLIVAKDITAEQWKDNEKVFNTTLEQFVLDGNFDAQIQKISDEMSEARLKQKPTQKQTVNA